MPGVVCMRDDIIIHGKNQREHDGNLQEFMNKCSQFNIKVNKEKLELSKDQISFMGHIISRNGISTDPKKVEAIVRMPSPTNTKEVRRIMGMIQYLAHYIPNLTNIMQPLQNMLKKDVPFLWSDSQEKAFQAIKQAIIDSPALAIYDPAKELVLENDASEYGVSSVLLQDGNPLAFASRTLQPAEQNYAQIEKELLAVTFGLRKFHHFTYGRTVHIITDHKPLESITKKPLCKAPRRLQNMLLKNQEYNYQMTYRPGSQLVISDCLSRAPIRCDENHEDTVCNLVYTPFKDHRLLEIKAASLSDPVMNEFKDTIIRGWPDHKDGVPSAVLPYFSYRDELTVQDGIILRGDRIIIPQSLRHDLKIKVHAGHQGVNSCLRRARDLIFWPGMSADIRAFVEACDTCATYCMKQPDQPLQTHDVPERPWQKVGTDIFTIKGYI
ncbi:transposon tf2-1 polyprotein [Plakobranchus ocellatus]|uniref:Transposon tf2-1 polyprotein n=1 Tax=Plakobranchus ocellatus TaxID=259542 RepID=A0AAV4AMB5_9GAST|nr:transposon tf2-1 polyprotein [Plakobranchus ocellatus]